MSEAEIASPISMPKTSQTGLVQAAFVRSRSQWRARWSNQDLLGWRHGKARAVKLALNLAPQRYKAGLKFHRCPPTSVSGL